MINRKSHQAIITMCAGFLFILLTGISGNMQAQETVSDKGYGSEITPFQSQELPSSSHGIGLRSGGWGSTDPNETGDGDNTGHGVPVGKGEIPLLVISLGYAAFAIIRRIREDKVQADK